jgi:hypothetical protein
MITRTPMDRCADCRYLVIVNLRGEVLDAPVDYRVSGASTSSRAQGTLRCDLERVDLAAEVQALAGTPRQPAAIVEVLWRLRDCDRYSPVGAGWTGGGR